jgi:predicted Zn-dependent peptidase
MKHTLNSFKTAARQIPLVLISAPDSNLLEFRLYFKVGFLSFEQESRHVPHMLEHLMLGQNPESGDVQQLTHALQRLGAIANASTDNEHVMIELTAPTDTALAAAEQILRIVGDPEISGKSFEAERQIILREVYERYDGLGAVIGARLMSQLMAPVTPDSPEAEIASVEALTPEKVKAAYKHYIHAGNVTAVVSGRAPHGFEEAYAKLLDRYIPAAGKDQPKKPTIAIPTEPVLAFEPGGDTHNASCLLAVVCPSGRTLPQAERVAGNMAFNMLFTTLDAVIPGALRRLGYVYSIGFDQVSVGDRMIFTVALSADAEALPKAIIEIHKLIKQYADAPFPADEFESISLYARHMLPISVETPRDLIDWYEGDILAGRKLVTLKEEIAVIESLKDKDLAGVIKRELADTAWNWGVIAPDAGAWAQSLFNELNKPSTRKLETEAYSRQLDIAVTRIPGDTKVLAAEYWDNLLWAGFALLEYAVLLTFIFTANFRGAGVTKNFSLWNLSVNIGNGWLIGGAILTLAAGGILGYFIERRYVKEISIILPVVAAATYWAALGSGYLRTVAGGFWEGVANTIQPFFFGLVVPLLVLSWIRVQLAKRLANNS